MRKKVLWALMAALLVVTACGKTDDDKDNPRIEAESGEMDANAEPGETNADADEANADAESHETNVDTQPGGIKMESSSEKTEDGTDKESASKEAAPTDAMKERFGERCISEQTFEVELSEYEGKVWFVPFVPSWDNPEFHMQIIQNDEVLVDISGYVPKELSRAGKRFQSLDAVSFYDINYDGETDIILIETCGDTTFAAVYYGFAHDFDGGRYTDFIIQTELSNILSEQAEEMSIAGIRSFLGGKRNGEFADYREAYETLMEFCALKHPGWQYDLIYFDEDDVPELTAGNTGYSISMYTYRDGTIYKVIDDWGYGAMGNPGYEYVPYQNSLRNYNADHAGLILYTTYMRMGMRHSMEEVVEIKTYHFDDANQNGMPDEAEKDSFGKYSVSYIDGREVSDEECAAYDVGGYEWMETNKDMEELTALLRMAE